MELQFLDLLSGLHTPWLDSIMVFITSLGDKGFLWILTALILLFIRKYRKDGILLFAALFFGFLICNVLLKNLVARERPFAAVPQILLIPPPQDFSFPSGHTMASFATAAVLLRADKRMGAAALILACLIAFSRMYLYVHYPTDVLGGLAVGLFSAWLAIRFVGPHLEKRLPNY